MYYKKSFLILLITLASFTNYVEAQAISASKLKVEYIENPVGIDIPDPRFSWISVSEMRGISQSAYQIQVADKIENLLSNGQKVWDSGKVSSSQSVNITYKGEPLKPGETYYWRVGVWDQNGEGGKWSKTGSFHVGPMKNSDWEGKWIGAADTTISAPILRKEFALSKPVASAYAYIVGLGYYELYLNGEKVGNHVLDPGTTDYNKRAYYVAYDVSSYINDNKNAVGVWLGRGYLNHRTTKYYADRPQLLFQLIVKHPDGTVTKIISDEQWKVSESPIVANSVYDGEIYDARKEKPGWNKPDFNDAGWKSAVQLETSAKRVISAQLMPPMRVTQTIRPVRMWEPAEGIYVYDFGQNVTGWPRIRVKGGQDIQVTMRTSPTSVHSMAMMKNLPLKGLTDTIDVSPNRSAKARDIYIMKGDTDYEIYEPRFTYHGFRYVQIQGFPGEPDLASIDARVVHSDVRYEGEFECSNTLLNQIHRNVIWGQLGNLHSIPTDTPHRDERQGWMGDAHLTAEEAVYNFDMAAFYTQWLLNIKDSQNEDGSVPDVVPHHKYPIVGTPAWQVAYPLLVWYMYNYFGDERIVSQHFESLEKYMKYMASISEEYIIRQGRGDWVPPRLAYRPSDGSVPITSTGYYFESARIMTQLAEILDNDTKQQEYQSLANNIKEAFNNEFLDRSKFSYGSGSQNSNAFALYTGIVPEDIADRVANSLSDQIRLNDEGLLTVGILGTKALVQALPKYNMEEVLYDITAHTEFPGWGYMIAKGATTLWERWGGYRYFNANMNSLNHIMFGSIDEFFYKDIAGIRYEAPGFEEILISPKMVGDLTSGSASTQTIRGKVATSWEKQGNAVILNIEIPANTNAKVRIPKGSLSGPFVVTESGITIWENNTFTQKAEGINSVSEKDKYIEVEVGSGNYMFKLSGS
jgi:alpha-L-rhamnosidase